MLRIGLAIAAFWGLAAAALAADGANDAAAPYKVLRNHNQFAVEKDGSYVQSFDRLFEIRTQQGLQALTQTTLAFSESLDDSDLTEVYTLKKDGRRIDAAPDQIFLRASPLATGAPMFNDFKVRIGVFPSAEIGDRVGFKGVIRRHKPLLPGQFSLVSQMGRSELVDDFQLDLSAPAEGMPLNIEALNIDNPKPLKKDGRLYWQWRFSNEHLEPVDDAASVNVYDRGGRLVVSSTKDYAALAKLYEQEAAPKLQPTEEIRSLAEEITAGQTDRRLQAKLLYDWVTKNIRYVAINIGSGAVVPHAAGQVLANRYGDCKDHVALLQTLLAVKGIASSGALINTGNQVTLTPVAALNFNHIITYLPDWNLYVDSTARYNAFESLPPVDRDRPVLLTASGKLSRTPSAQADEEGLRFVSHVKLREDGSAEVDSDIQAKGQQAVLWRAQMQDLMRPDLEAAFIRRHFGNNATGSVQRDDWNPLTPDYHLSAHYIYEDYISVPGPGALFPLGLSSGMTAASFVSLTLKERHYDYICASNSLVEDITVELPPNLSILAVPKDVQWEDANHKFTLTYERIGEKAVRTVRTYRFQQLEPSCKAESYNQRRPQMLPLRSALRAAVIYQ